jgi:predicted alpha/beta-hydrolase family hydrolase
MAGPNTPLKIAVGEQQVSGLHRPAKGARACLVLAHGAGAGMTHPFMEAVAQGLSDRGISTLRFQFPYMENKSKRPDPPPVAQAAVRAAVIAAASLEPKTPLFAGGKSFGGRMTSQAEASEPLPQVRGLIFLGFPLHPAKQPSDKRAEHLADVQIPMLFIQGTRDDLADLELLRPITRKLGKRATLTILEHADHSFHVPAKSGRNDAEILSEALDAVGDWVSSVVKS